MDRKSATRFPALLSVALLVTVLFMQAPRTRAAAISFGTLSIDFVEIEGSAAADVDGVTVGSPRTPVGGVAYDYTIGTYEIRESHIGAYNAANLVQITKDTRGPDKPATLIDWYEAAHFVNWLNRLTGASEAYKWNGGAFETWVGADPGYDASNEFRNSGAIYWLPAVDEWHKAAYGSPDGTWYDYPTGSDTLPTEVSSGTGPGTAVFNQGYTAGPADVNLAGGLSGYGVMGMGGNASEWEETAFDYFNDDITKDRAVRGGAWFDNGVYLQSSFRGIGIIPSTDPNWAGFRVAGADLATLQAAEAAAGFGGGGPGPVPEPSRAVLLLLGAVPVLMRRRR